MMGGEKEEEMCTGIYCLGGGGGGGGEGGGGSI